MATPREMLAKVYATAGTRDWDAVEALIHPDFVLYEANSLPFAGEWRGKDALQRCAAAMYGTWADTKLEMLDCTGGDTWAVTFQCPARDGRPATSGRGTVTLQGATGYAGDFTMNTQVDKRTEQATMKTQGRWLSADCGSVKPIRR